MIQWVMMEVMYVGKGEHYYRAVWHKLSCEGSRTSMSSRPTLEQMTQVELLTERYLGEGDVTTSRWQLVSCEGWSESLDWNCKW